MESKLAGKVAIVGGSTQGIGRAIALKFAQNGADVVINGRNPKPGLEVVEEVENLKRRALFKQADLTNYAQVKEMVEDVIQKWGNIDIVVASGGAGNPPVGFFHDIDPELYAEFMKVKMFTRLHMARAVLDHMKDRKKGKIILISTDAGRVPTPGESINGAAAAGLVLMTKVLAREFSRWKIHINTICTTVTIDTPGYERAIQSDSTGKIFQRAAQRMPFWPLTPNDIAELSLFLASGDSDRITGQIFSVNGGLSFPG